MRAHSFEAYQNLMESGALQGLRRRAYEVLAVNGPLPLFRFSEYEGPKDYGGTLAKRVSELVKMGLAMSCGEVVNPRSGRMCALFDVTSRTVPLPLEKSELQRLREENQSLRRQLRRTLLEVHAPRQQELIG